MLDHPKTGFRFSHSKTLEPGDAVLGMRTFRYEFRKLNPAPGLPKAAHLYFRRDMEVFEMIKVAWTATPSCGTPTPCPSLTDRIRQKAPAF